MKLEPDPVDQPSVMHADGPQDTKPDPAAAGQTLHQEHGSSGTLDRSCQVAGQNQQQQESGAEVHVKVEPAEAAAEASVKMERAEAHAQQLQVGRVAAVKAEAGAAGAWSPR